MAEKKLIHSYGDEVEVYVARQEVPTFFPGASPKTLANLNSKGLGPKPYKNGRISFYKYKELLRHYTGEEK